MTNERFEFKDGKLYWISDEDTLIVEGWPSLRCEYIQGTACEPDDNPVSIDDAACTSHPYKTLNRLLYPPRVKLVLNREYPDFEPSDPRYYLAPGYTDRILRERIQPVIANYRAPLLAFFNTFPVEYLDEIIKYEVEHAGIARSFALNVRFYELSVTYPALFLLVIYYAFRGNRSFPSDGLLNRAATLCFYDEEAGVPEIFLSLCVKLNPIEILELLGRTEDAPLFLSRLCKYKRGTSLWRYLRTWIFPSLHGGICFEKSECLRVVDHLGELHANCLVMDEYIANFPKALLESVAGQHPCNSSFSSEWFVQMVYECIQFKKSGVSGLSDADFEQCESFQDLQRLYRIRIERKIGYVLERQRALPVATPWMRPIETFDEFRAAASELACPVLWDECHHERVKLFRLLSPAKGIFVYRNDDCKTFDFFTSRLYLDYGATASIDATHDIWMQACRENDWSGISDEDKNRIMGQIYYSPED